MVLLADVRLRHAVLAEQLEHLVRCHVVREVAREHNVPVHLLVARPPLVSRQMPLVAVVLAVALRRVRVRVALVARIPGAPRGPALPEAYAVRALTGVADCLALLVQLPFVHDV